MSKRFAIETAPGRWVKLSTAQKGSFMTTNVWGEAYKCSEEMANRIADKLRFHGIRGIRVVPTE